MIEKVRKYAQSFKYEHLHSVYQFIRKFKWSYDGERLMKQLIDEIDGELRRAAERQQQARRRYRKLEGTTPVINENDQDVSRDFQEPGTIQTVVGFCPKCGSYLRGMPTPACAKAKNGRHFYKECESCTYISEIWKRNNKFFETDITPEKKSDTKEGG